MKDWIFQGFSNGFYVVEVWDFLLESVPVRIESFIRLAGFNTEKIPHWQESCRTCPWVNHAISWIMLAAVFPDLSPFNKEVLERSIGGIHNVHLYVWCHVLVALASQISLNQIRSVRRTRVQALQIDWITTLCFTMFVYVRCAACTAVSYLLITIVDWSSRPIRTPLSFSMTRTTQPWQPQVANFFPRDPVFNPQPLPPSSFALD